MRVVLVSYTPIGAGGGVPRFNRDLTAVFRKGVCQHYSWWDVARAFGKNPEAQDIPEWEKAKVLNQWLLQTRRVTSDDVVIADSFWAAGLEHLPMCVSHQHGNWGHVTKDDRERGVQPEFPVHERVQNDFRKRCLDAGRRLTAVSDFIAHQMHVQWGFPSTVINNGIDTSKFVPATDKKPRKRPVIVHFSTTWNKGLDHVDYVKKNVDADVVLLDDLGDFFKLPKYPALAQADLALHPSAHEGNSYAVLETLSSGVPIVAYDVGLLYEIRREGRHNDIGRILDRRNRDKETTVYGVVDALADLQVDTDIDGNRNVPGHMGYNACIESYRYSIREFRKNWLRYLSDQFGVSGIESTEEDA